MRATHQRPNQAAAGKAGIAILFAAGCFCPGLPEPVRSAKCNMKALRAYLVLAIVLVTLVSGCATEQGQVGDQRNDWAHGTGDFLWNNVWSDGLGNARSH